MRVLWFWPHPHEVLNPSAEPLLDRGDELTIQCLTTFRGQPGDPRVVMRRELPEVRPFTRLPAALRRVLRVETYVRRAWRRERLVRRGSFDVCHVAMPNYLVDAFALGRLRRLVPIVLVVHDVVPHHARVPSAVEQWLLRRVYGSADVIVVLHEVVAAELRREFAVEPGRIVVVHNPVAPVADAPPVGGGGSTPTRFLAFGSLRHDKGLPQLLEAARRLADDPMCRIHIAGTGEPALERAVARSAERGDVTAELGWVTPARKDELMRDADVVLLAYSDPERFRSQSGVLADAYAYRRPVIASDIGAIGPTVGADGTGWLVPPGSADALAETIRTVARDAQGRAAAAAAVEAAQVRYSHYEHGQALRGAYELALERRRASA